MGSFTGHAIENFYKIALFFVGLAIVFYILIDVRLWSADWTEYFLKRGNWLEVVFVSLIVAGVSIVILKLFQLQLRLETRRK